MIMLMKNWWVSRNKNRLIGWFVTSMQCKEINPDLKKIFVLLKKNPKNPHHVPLHYCTGIIASILLFLALNVNIKASDFGKFIILRNTEAFPSDFTTRW